MTEQLITDLAKVGSLRVISRTSVMRYKGTKKGLPEIARVWLKQAEGEWFLLRMNGLNTIISASAMKVQENYWRRFLSIRRQLRYRMAITMPPLRSRTRLQ